MTDEELEDLEDEIKKLEKLDDLLSSESEYGSPKPEKKDSTLRFFRELIAREDSKKFGNLLKEELGKSQISVRGLLDVAQYAYSEQLDEVGDYLNQKAENILATSLSHKGFLAQLFVTQIKKEQKLKEKAPTKTGGLFGKKKEESENE